MEVGQSPNWGCSAKEKKVLYSLPRMTLSSIKGTREFYIYLFIHSFSLYIQVCSYHAIKTHWEVEGKLQIFSILALDKGEWPTSCYSSWTKSPLPIS
jgi:hypothetical protein